MKSCNGVPRRLNPYVLLHCLTIILMSRSAMNASKPRSMATRCLLASGSSMRMIRALAFTGISATSQSMAARCRPTDTLLAHALDVLLPLLLLALPRFSAMQRLSRRDGIVHADLKWTLRRCHASSFSCSFLCFRSSLSNSHGSSPATCWADNEPAGEKRGELT